MSLDISSQIEWLLMHRMREGHTTEFFTQYFDDGQWIKHTAELAL
ncbi:MAG: hypothetical protein ACRDS1_06030 [Pseudonocardiaceae bacterium]